jgi:hypothetical protein
MADGRAKAKQSVDGPEWTSDLALQTSDLGLWTDDYGLWTEVIR